MKLTGPVVITGGNGMLAWDLARSFSAVASEKSVLSLSRSQVDISDSDNVDRALSELKPSLVINSAAYTNVDKAETEKEAAFAANAAGPKNLAKWAEKNGVKFVHFSTDQVFDGTKQAPQTETDPINPLNYYAESKSIGEKEALTYGKSVVFRVQWLYGEKKDRFSILKDKATFSPFADQYGAPTWTRFIADTVVTSIEKNLTGLYHLSHDNYGSWTDVFQFVKEFWHLGVKLEPRITAELNLPAKRPLFSVISNEKLKRDLGLATLGNWQGQLKQFLELKTI